MQLVLSALVQELIMGTLEERRSLLQVRQLPLVCACAVLCHTSP
jgi:hypothetical protein